MGYEEALRRIEWAKKTGATELDLSWQELTELPTERVRRCWLWLLEKESKEDCRG